MTAQPLSPDEQIVLAYFEDQPPAPESFRLRLARELFAWDAKWYELADADAARDYGSFEDMADRAIEVMRGERDLAALDREFAPFREADQR
jgi:hypothetical protein